MGFFDIFKKNKKQSELAKVMNQLQGQMFPGGKSEVMAQVNEVKKLLSGNYPMDAITGTFTYMTTMFTVTQDKSAERVVRQGALRRPHNQISEEDAMTMYKYIVRRHLIQNFGTCDDMMFNTFYAAIGNSEDGCKTDVIPEGYGEYGLCSTNPVPVRGIASSEVYLGKLRLENGEAIKWQRVGSTGAPNIKNSIDIYRIHTVSGREVGLIYISPYQATTSKIAPKGYKMV